MHGGNREMMKVTAITATKSFLAEALIRMLLVALPCNSFLRCAYFATSLCRLVIFLRCHAVPLIVSG